MALAEAPRPPLPAAAPQRSRRALDEQKQIITLALRSVLADDDAREAPVVLPGRGEAPRVERRRSVGRGQAAHAAAINALVDMIPKHVLCHLPLALGQLPLEDRALLRLYIQLGHSRAATARALRLKRPEQVDVRADAALGQLARLLWQESGEPRLP